MYENSSMEAVANDLRETASDLKVDTLLSLVRAAEVANRYLDLEMSKYGARRARSGVLNVLIVNGGKMRPTDLSKKLFRAKHTITSIVDGLEKEGLVRRETTTEDRRIRKIAITKVGLEFVKATASYRRDISYKAFSWLDVEQTQELNNMLTRLRKHLLLILERKGNGEILERHKGP